MKQMGATGWAVVLGMMLIAGTGRSDDTRQALVVPRENAEAARPVAEAPPGALAVIVDLPIFSAYVTRGQIINDEAVLQPALTVTRGGLTISAIGNINLTDRPGMSEDAPAFSEVDLTLSYGLMAGPVGVTVGLVEYLFPNTTVAVAAVPDVGIVGNAARATHGPFLTVSAPTWKIVPSATIYRDIDEVDGAYATGGLTWTHMLGPTVALALGGSVGCADRKYNARLFGVDKAGWNNAAANAVLYWRVSETLTLTPVIQYTTLLGDETKDAADAIQQDTTSLWGGLKASWRL